MLVRYERTLADVDAYCDFYCESKVTKRGIARYRLRSSIAVGVLTFVSSYLAFNTESPLLALGLGAAAGLVFAASASSIYKNATRRNIRRSYEPNSGVRFAKDVELELLESGFVVRTALVETKYAWAALERIESRPGYTFLCIDGITAVGIPHKGIVSGDFPAMLAEIGRRYHPDHQLPAIR